MRRAVAVLACAAVLAAPGQAAVLPDAKTRALERIASRFTGLPVKRHVRVELVARPALASYLRRRLDRVYPPARQRHDEALYRALGLLGERETLRTVLLEAQARPPLGLYDPDTRRLLVRRDGDVRRTALHEIVHALQDQSYDLRRLARLRSSRDASLAAVAAVEGHASLAVGLLGRRVPASHGGSRVRLFLAIEREFPYATGLRLAAALETVGGRGAVLSALRRFPETTEQVFHLDAFLAREPAVPIALPATAAGFVRESVDSFGELDVRALLAVFQVPRLDHVGEGWGGGATAVYRRGGDEAVVVALAWDDPTDAAEWEEAVAVYVNEAFDADEPGLLPAAGCAACWEVGGRGAALARQGTATALAFAPATAEAEALAAEVVSAMVPR